MNYFIKQRLFNIWRSSFYIKNEAGEDCYEVKSDFNFLKRLTIYDLDKNPLLKIKKRYFRFLPRFDVCSPDGESILIVKSKFSLFTRKCKILSQLKEFDNMKIDGNVFAWNFFIKQDDKTMVEISKRIFKIADSYCISINDEKNALSYLAIVVILDCIYHSGK